MSRDLFPMRDLTRRDFLHSGGSLVLLAAAQRLLPSYAWAGAASPELPTDRQSVIDIDIGELPFDVGGRTGTAIAMNGAVPGPTIRLKEGSEAVLRVRNRLSEITSIHWHGLILPPEMDGVPGVSFGGIGPGETFTYRFPVRQSGTYWCHSHSGGQELLGLYSPLIIDPIDPDPFGYDRDYVVLLSDWSFESPGEIIDNLKKQAGYYNYQRRTASDFARDIQEDGLGTTLRERLEWGRMRMDPTDFADVTGATYTYLMNGLTPEVNWTGLFTPGERVRLRFIDAAAMTLFDVRIPNLKMTVVQADGQNVQPVQVDEFRIAPGETLDVIVEPAEQAYTVFAEAIDRSGYGRGTLATHAGQSAPIPPQRPRPLRTMADMGMSHEGMGPVGDAAGMSDKGAAHVPGSDQGKAAIVGHGGMPMNASSERPSSQTALQGPAVPGGAPRPHGPDSHGPGNSAVPMMVGSRLQEPGAGFEDTNSRVLVYADLKSLVPAEDQREPEREIELHITGNMERYIWSFDGKKYSEARTPIAFRYGERLRLILVNDTMMDHPIHLHGMWMELENGSGEFRPRKHTISVKPAERLTVAITADAPGKWAMHCHLLLHMEMGMFRVVEIAEPGKAVR